MIGEADAAAARAANHVSQRTKYPRIMEPRPHPTKGDFTNSTQPASSGVLKARASRINDPIRARLPATAACQSSPRKYPSTTMATITPIKTSVNATRGCAGCPNPWSGFCALMNEAAKKMLVNEEAITHTNRLDGNRSLGSTRAEKSAWFG